MGTVTKCTSCCYNHYSRETHPCNVCTMNDNMINRVSIDDATPEEWNEASRKCYKAKPELLGRVPWFSDFDRQAYCERIIETVPADNVNSPDHYTAGGIETIDYIKAKLGTEGTINYCMGNVIKYTSRWQDKNGLEDLKKARWYLEYAIDLLDH